MPITRASKARQPRGSSSVSAALVIAVALSSGALGVFGNHLVERARDVFGSPLDASILAGSMVESATTPDRPRRFPREASALRAALQRPSPPMVTAELVGRLGLMGDASDLGQLETLMESRSPWVRHAALRAITQVGGVPGVERVAAWARAPIGDEDVYPAVLALAHSEEDLAEEVLVELASSSEQWRRGSAMTALAMRGGKRARTILHRELRSGPLMHAWDAAHNVAHLGEAVDARLLMSLAAGNGRRADAALGALGSLPGTQVDGFLVDLAATATGPRKGQLLSALGQVRDPAALDVIDDALAGPVRWHTYAWTALGDSQAPGALELLLDWMQEARPAEASDVATALAARPELEARQALRALAGGADAFADAALSTLANAEDPSTTALLIARYDEEGKLPPSEALVFLATHGGEEGWQLIEEVLAEGGQSDRSSVVFALQMRGDEDAQARLLAVARGGDPAMAPQAQGALEEMGEAAREALRGLLVERIEAGEVNDWGQSVQTLGRLGGEEVRTLLLARVHDGSSKERTNAVSALAQMDDPEAQAALADVFRTSSDAGLKSQALNSLLWSPDGLPSDLLDEALADADPTVVAQVVGSLPQTGRDDVGARLMTFADSDDPSIRAAALGALAQTGGAEAEAALVAALNDPDVGQQAVWNLQSMGTRGARDALRSSAQADDPRVRSAAIGALGSDPSPEADAILREALEADDEDIVLASVSALQSRGNSAAGEALAELLTSLKDEGDSPVRMQAAWALRAIGGRFAEEHADLIGSAQGMPMDDVWKAELSELHLGGVPLLFE